MEASLVRAARVSYQFWTSVSHDAVWRPREQLLDGMHMYVHGRPVPENVQNAQQDLENLGVVLACGSKGNSYQEVLLRIPTMRADFAKGMVGLANYMAAQKADFVASDAWDIEEARACIDDLRANEAAQLADFVEGQRL